MKNVFTNERERKYFVKRTKENFKNLMFGSVIFVVVAGFLGIFVTANLFVIPLFIGMVMNGKDKDVENVEVQQGMTQKVGEFWQHRSPTQKVGIGIGLAVLIPFVFIAILWLMVVGVAFAIDMLFIIPVLFIVGYVFYRNKEKQTNVVGRFFGHPVVGFIGVVMVIALIMITGINFVDSHQYDGVRDDFKSAGEPLHTSSSDFNTTIEPFFNTTSGQWENKTVLTPKIANNILFKVVDDFFYNVGFLTNLNQTYNSTTGELGLSDTSGQLPVDNAKVSIVCYDNQNQQLLNIGGFTTAEGLITFKEVPYGIYEVTVDAGGYLKFNKEIHIDERFTNGTVKIHMRPVYYKVGLDYTFSEDVLYHENFLFFDTTYSVGNVYLDAYYLGGLSRADIENIKRTQSWYGWSGIPNTGVIQNSMLNTRQQLNQIFQSVTQGFDFWRLLAPIPKSTYTTEYTYGGHTVTVNECKVVDAQSFQYDTYWAQLPTANSQRAEVDADGLIQFQQDYMDWLNSTAEGDENVTKPDISLVYSTRNDTLHYSALPFRHYEYIVWSEVPDSQTITMQFEVTTRATNRTYQEAQFSYFYFEDEIEEDVYLTETVSVQFTNLLPTVESPIVGG